MTIKMTSRVGGFKTFVAMQKHIDEEMKMNKVNLHVVRAPAPLRFMWDVENKQGTPVATSFHTKANAMRWVKEHKSGRK